MSCRPSPRTEEQQENNTRCFSGLLDTDSVSNLTFWQDDFDLPVDTLPFNSDTNDQQSFMSTGRNDIPPPLDRSGTQTVKPNIELGNELKQVEIHSESKYESTVCHV